MEVCGEHNVEISFTQTLFFSVIMCAVMTCSYMFARMKMCHLLKGKSQMLGMSVM